MLLPSPEPMGLYRFITADELAANLGGAAKGVFAKMDQNKDGNISPFEWFQFFEMMIKSDGDDVMSYMLQHYENYVIVQGIVQKMIDDSSSLHTLLSSTVLTV